MSVSGVIIQVKLALQQTERSGTTITMPTKIGNKDPGAFDRQIVHVQPVCRLGLAVIPMTTLREQSRSAVAGSLFCKQLAAWKGVLKTPHVASRECPCTLADAAPAESIYTQIIHAMVKTLL